MSDVPDMHGAISVPSSEFVCVMRVAHYMFNFKPWSVHKVQHILFLVWEDVPHVHLGIYRSWKEYIWVVIRPADTCSVRVLLKLLNVFLSLWWLKIPEVYVTRSGASQNCVFICMIYTLLPGGYLLGFHLTSWMPYSSDERLRVMTLVIVSILL